MRIVRYLAKNINLLNIGLLTATGAVVLVAVTPLFHAKAGYVPPALKSKAMLQEEVLDESGQAPSPADYLVMVDNNLFHPDRRLPPEKKEVAPLPRPELVLFGTVITDSVSIAYIEDKKSPKTTEGRGKRQSAVKKGDMLGGFMVRDIQPDRIVLVRGEESMAVHLMEAGKQRGGDKAAPAGPGLTGVAKNSPASTSKPPSAALPFQRNPLPVAPVPSLTTRAAEPQNGPVPAPALSARSMGRYQKMQGQQ